VLLDLHRGSYLAVDPVSAVVWRALACGTNLLDAEQAVLSAYDTTADDVRSRIAAFVDRCIADDLLRQHDSSSAPPSDPPDSSTRSRPSTLPSASAWIALLRTRRMLARNGFGRAYSSLAALGKPPGQSAEAVDLAAAMRAFTRAENLFWLARAPNDCLPRSMALYAFLLSEGIAASHVIGVRSAPFAAHAWVRAGGRPMLESEEWAAQFHVIAEL